MCIRDRGQDAVRIGVLFVAGGICLSFITSQVLLEIPVSTGIQAGQVRQTCALWSEVHRPCCRVSRKTDGHCAVAPALKRYVVSTNSEAAIRKGQRWQARCDACNLSLIHISEPTRL